MQNVKTCENSPLRRCLVERAQSSNVSPDIGNLASFRRLIAWSREMLSITNISQQGLFSINLALELKNFRCARPLTTEVAPGDSFEGPARPSLSSHGPAAVKSLRQSNAEYQTGAIFGRLGAGPLESDGPCHGCSSPIVGSGVRTATRGRCRFIT